jgi:uncharacterized protein (TIGR03790 family)
VVLLVVFLVILVSPGRCWAGEDDGRVEESRKAITPDRLAVIVNDADPLSIGIADYYRKRRGIPTKQIIHVNFPPGTQSLSRTEFYDIKALVDRKTPERVQAFVLTWVKPYRVECMSITTAFAAGFDEAFCGTGCVPTKISPYFNSNSWAPHRHYNLRPTMSLAAASLDEAKRLIDRGMASDNSVPAGTGYLVETSDKNRSVRSAVFDPVMRQFGSRIKLERVQADFVEGKPDVLFYFTGIVDVPKLKGNTFIPGAIGDHLTSTGGVLDGIGQMSSLRWLEAGATGSYGTVVEPCNFPAKFPNPGIVIGRYLQGETLIEAYWKSVAMPGQGIFIGEPLARPFGKIPQPAPPEVPNVLGTTGD